MKNKMKGYGLLTALNLRRDRLNIGVWVLVLAGLMASVAFKFETLYGTRQAIASIKATLNTPAMQAFFGTFDTPLKTSGDLFATEMLVFMAIAMIAMNIYFAIRATRGEEDQGLTELVVAHDVGNWSIIMAALTELFTINAVTGVLYSLAIQFSSMAGVNANGAWLIGLSLAAGGLLFGMVGLLMAQVFDNARSATIASYMILGVMYVARMFTDLKNPAQTWWVPLGWIEKIEAFHDNNWTPVFLTFSLGMLIGLAVLAVNQSRDVGAGMFQGSAGRARAARTLQGPITLIEKLQRHSNWIWLFSLFILGGMLGSIFDTVGDILKSNPTMQLVMQKSAIHSASHQILLNFISIIGMIMAVLGTIPAVMSVNKLHGDQQRGYLENVYAKAVSRNRLLTGYVANGVGIGVLGFAVGLLGVDVAGNWVLTQGDISFAAYVKTFIAFAPTIILTVGLAVCFNGIAPKLNGITWLYLGYAFFTSYLGGLLKLPAWTKQLTGLGWTKMVPLDKVNYSYVFVLIALGLLLMVIGYWGFNRRDLS